MMMEVLLSPASLQREVAALAAGAYLSNPVSMLAGALELYQPPERISTVECAEKYRVLPAAEAGGTVRYDRWQTPGNVGPMHALDDPRCDLLVMVKPSRSGGTCVAENYLFKIALLGPLAHCCWVLNSDEAVTDYCRNVVKPMFDLNPPLAARVGSGRGDNTDAFKRLGGYPFEWLSAKDSTFRNREPLFMVWDETDAAAKKYAAAPRTQIDGRQKRLGSRRKGAILSHPDLGWNAGVGSEYEATSRGIYIMRCAARRCRKYAAAYATKFWDDVPEFKLAWSRNPALGNDERIALATRSAHMLCPHCGAKLTDAQRRAMVDEALREGEKTGTYGWMHRGQTLDAVQGIVGEMAENGARGFWTHGLMLKSDTIGKLARDYEEALIKFERSQDVTKLKEFLSKALGEIFEGAATTGGVSAKLLKERVRESGYDRGIVPDDALFITAAIDTGGRYFDVMWIGWDLEGRSWLLDRQTIRQRQHADGIWRDIHLSTQIEDWDVLLPLVVDRLFPMAGAPDMALPVAATCIDSGDGNVTWKAREFARRALRKGYTWGGWSKIKLVKGFAGKRPILSDPRRVDKDENGRPVEPVTVEYNIGADAGKELVIERLAIVPHRDGSPKPGQCFFPRDLEGHYVDQFFGETLIDGKWKRNGPNESLDTHVYNEAARLMLRPDRTDIDWITPGKRPVWAMPVSLRPAETDEKTSTIRDRFERFDRLGSKGKPS